MSGFLLSLQIWKLLTKMQYLLLNDEKKTIIFIASIR